MGDPRNFALTTVYPPDKIIDSLSGSFTATKSNTPPFTSFRTNVTINHTYGDTVFPVLIYSRDGGSTWQDANVTVPSGINFQTLDVSCYSTTTTIVVMGANWTNADISVLYKVAILSKS